MSHFPSPSTSPTHLGGVAAQWLATAEAAEAELVRLAALLTKAGVTVDSAAGLLSSPELACAPGDTTGIRARTTSCPPHALYIVTVKELTPHTDADDALALLHPLIEASARSCDGCGAEPGEPCRPNCPDPTGV
ncbi:hypothetical protein ACFVVP_39230 [Streptomyces sp. NPDC058128]|uniref:hypothetical protein n=1 Tax=Streptomyces sp. NPDC058128 TaxID=3346352 RepID=UPI0036E00121